MQQIFRMLNKAYQNNEFETIFNHRYGNYFLKLRSLSKTEILRNLAETAEINIDNIQGRQLFEHLFCQNIPQAVIDNFIRQNQISFDKNATDDAVFKELLTRITEHPSQEARSFIQNFHQIRRAIIHQSIENPNELIVWFYENQGIRRFDASNRLFVVLIDPNNLEESWKLKRNRDILSNGINEFLNQNRNIDFNQYRINFNWNDTSYQSHAICLFIIKQ